MPHGSSVPYPCGQCNPCRINRRRVWSHRLILEASKHASSTFVTLTYDPEHLPPDQSLNPVHTQLWLKRFRKAVSPLKIRYYLVGEYGDETQRPHYHAALYGVSVDATEIVRDTWGMGHVYLGDLTIQSAQYIAGYVVKKMTAGDDPRLLGRHPEFARMSLRPGIGATAMDDVAETLATDSGCDYLLSHGDVPSFLQHGSKKLPLGRYLKNRLRQKIGMPQEMIDVSLQKYSDEMQAMQADLKFDPKAPKTLTLEDQILGHSLQRKRLLHANKQKVATLEARTKIFKSSKEKPL